ncbi:MAG TPA: Ldh family oxidoreductase [Bacillota bacterium]|jgi:LDH2 family malate/lactate/ureidoglycolate dehydrogenase|nr:Ldh family oxidoreductase [Bacillota bacterium]HOB86293.1 Ldh family oxidoreductase [Bacillota bacterium]HOP69986.1 Ldh family oxidoreductase [Bacillota bacterium]HPT33654.1 Ldh family oxidoreductase [Bacillota bacterium]HPZ64230.1 Ldh family oxidoreductase [Bacillota bacterium]
MEEKVAWLDLALLTRFVVDVFLGLGVPQEEAKICADVVVAADELGIESHGIARLKSFYYDRIKAGIQFPVTNFEIIREGPTTAVVDGHLGMGQVIAAKSMELAMAKARRCGMGMVAVRNSSHYGIAGYYVAMAAKAGMIGITGTNARPSIAPTFGVENMLGTNPLAFGLPTDEEFPFILDGATSVTQRGKIELYARERKALPAGWVMDNQGNDVTDPLRALEDLERGRAALAPLGGKGEEGAGYKGYGYAAVVEILSTALQGGVFLKGLQKNLPEKGKGQKEPYRLGHFFMAIDISAFTDPEDFRRRTGELLRALRNSQKAPGKQRIYTPGEKEYLAQLERREKGVPVGASVQREMMAMRDELGLNYRFPFE